MKKSLIFLSLIVFVFSCKQKEVEKTVNANGFEHWERVSKIEFTFNVDRDSSHLERSWT